jgi:3-hydroxy-9,10-secoandrosta-1,3,5(10)-triene-9,17-dione monooxygenase
MADDSSGLPLADRRIPAGGDWLSAAELSEITPQELIRRTTALKPLLAANAREAERLRRPIDTVWDALRKSGVFYHFVPKVYGGLEFDVDTFIDAMLPLGEACASTGWVAAFCVEHNWMLSQFPKEMQDETFGGSFPYIVAPGVTNPPGTAVPVDGGYRLTGRWKWATGVMHADWVLASGSIPGESPPRMLFFAIPADQVVVLDTWHVDGMIGTGSNDVMVNDLFVPAHRVMDFGEMREGRAPGSKQHAHNPIYRMPMLPFLAVTAAIPAVGQARAAVAYFRDRLQERVLHGTTVKQAEKPAAQMRLAHADVLTSTAELLIRHVARENVELAKGAAPAKVEQRIALRVKVAHAMSLCREAIRTVCEASGSGSHFLDNPLQRGLRDINVMSSHVVYDLDGALELHGRALIGLPPNSPVV